MVFEALYFDGQSSFGNNANIKLTHLGIEIELQNATMFWSIEQLNLKESYIHKSKNILKFGNNFPYQVLEVDSDSFQIHFKREFPNVNLTKNSSGFFDKITIRITVMLIAITLGLLLLSYFVIIPELSEFVAKKLPKEYEVSLGQEIYSQMETSMLVDSEKTVLANRFFNELNIQSEYPIKITVVTDDIPNAFALPGGHIVVYDKMFELMKSKEEFAALLCHEYSHIAYRHTTRSLFRNLGTYFIISMVLTDVNGIMAVLLQNADNLKSLSYTRNLEQEADEKGLAIMQEKGVNPKGMIQLFKHLKNASKANVEIPTFLSTHPMLEDRMKNIKKLNQAKPFVEKPNATLDEIWTDL